MARFRATIQGSRGGASRLGTTNSGIQATVDGWNGGVFVRGTAQHDPTEYFEVWTSKGSNGSIDKMIGLVDERGNFKPSDWLRSQIIKQYLAEQQASK